MTCGCCAEGCPQVNKKSKFIGPAPISQVRLFNNHLIGRMDSDERLQILMEDGGIASCGNAQNCSKVCPKKIPLTESIAKIGRDVSKEAIRNIFGIEDD